MNSRALYWMAKAVVEAIRWAGFTLLGALFAFFSDLPGLVVLAFIVFLGGVAYWCAGDAQKALRALKAEANRDTLIGLNGPSTREHLIP